MVEEENKPEETKAEEERKPEETKKEEETKAEETKDEKESNGEAAADAAPAPPPPPQEIVLKVFMHCEGCARKVRRSLKGFPGVEDVITDCKSSTVVVKGEKADPLKVLERVQGKSHRLVELLSPIPILAEEEKKLPEEEEKPEEKKEEPPQIVTVLKVHMHCENCAQEMKKRIEKIKGVESAEADLKKWEVIVKGVIDPAKLVQYVYKRFGKHAVIVKQEVAEEKKETVEEVKEEKKEEEVGEKENEEKKITEGEEKGEGEGNGEKAQEEEKVEVTEETKLVEEMKILNEYYFNTPRNGMELYHAYPAAPAPAPAYYYQTYPPPPQLFSDENPNACTVM